MLRRRINDSVNFFMNELSSRVVAESTIPSDRHHLGKLILRSLKDAPDFVLQIDGATGESETCSSVLKRSVRFATALRRLGLQRGDVMVLMAPNHLDLAIPYYAALYLGIIIAPIDRTFTSQELEENFKINRPKIIFCQSVKERDIQCALKNLDLNAQIVTFDKTHSRLPNSCSFTTLMEQHGNDCDVENFKATDFDPAETIAILLATSGTTGLPKSAAVTHKAFSITGPHVWCRYFDFPTPTKMVLIVSVLQWLTAVLPLNMSPIMRFTRLQSSLPMTQEHAYQLINKYRPTFMVGSPGFMTMIFKSSDRHRCDFSSFELIVVGGSAVYPQLLMEMKSIMPKAEIYEGYGMSETSTYFTLHADEPPPGSAGKPVGHTQYRLIDTETLEEITEAHKSGELWLKGPGMFKEYYNNEKATREVFTKDGWLKTGDIFYRDESWNFFYVDRLKLLLKYMNHQISPLEIEGVIRTHPEVFDVAVTGVPDGDKGDLVVACVVRKPGCNVNAQEIKAFVKESLTESKQLRGGVIFIDQLPMTVTTKVDRKKLKQIALKMERE